MVHERPLTVFLNGAEFATIICSPEVYEELVLGFLYSEGLIRGRQDVYGIRTDPDAGLIWLETVEMLRTDNFLRRNLASCCGRGRAGHKCLVLSGRIASEILIKAARAETAPGDAPFNAMTRADAEGPRQEADPSAQAEPALAGILAGADFIGIQLIQGPVFDRRDIGHHHIGPHLQSPFRPSSGCSEASAVLDGTVILPDNYEQQLKY